MLPGQANSHRWWDGLRAAFADAFRTVTFDYRGTGDTRADETDAASWTTSSFAADAVAVLDDLGYDDVLVYGTSMGGRVAQRLVVEHPARVRRLVLACTSPGGPEAVERSVEVRLSLSRRDPDAVRRALLELMYTPAWLATHDGSTLLGDPTMSAAARRGHLRASARHDAWDRLPEVGVPVLVTHGDADLMAPVRNAELLAARVPGAELQLVAGGRHGFFEEFADQVVPRVRGFLGA
nr:alpha/beta hydrolase [Nocardioides panaciterrulae]